MKDKTVKTKWGMRVVFAIGFLLCCFPLVYNMVEHKRQEEAVATYQKAVTHEEEKSLAEALERAAEYNSMLYQSSGAVVDQMDTDVLSDESYSNQLDVGTGIMGSIEIPKINVNLPIYHGTEDEVLSNGIGHIQGTSLPVGGNNTHCVLTGHRGLPSSKLLVRLDEIKEGDLFFIRVCNKTLAYKVSDIQIVLPDDVSSLQIKSDEDLVSLVTCTPYGINNKRLIVTGKRVEYKEAEREDIKEKIPSGRELLLTAIPFIFIVLSVVLYVKDRRRLKDENKKD